VIECNWFLLAKYTGSFGPGPWDQLGILVASFLLAYSDKNWELTSRFPRTIHCTVAPPPNIVEIKSTTAAVNVTLLAFAEDRRATVPLLVGDIAVGRYFLRAECSAANPPHAATAVNRRDHGTDTGPLHRPCSAYCASDVNNQPLVEISKHNYYQLIRKNCPSRRIVWVAE